MGDDAEKIAMVIETQAQLAGLRQASSETASFAGQVRDTANNLKTDLDTSVAALNSLGITAKVTGGNIAVASKDIANAEAILAKIGGSAKVVDAAIKQTTATTAQLGTVATQAATASKPLIDSQDAMSPRLRTSALAASRLTLVLDGMGGGMQGLARSVGTLSYGLADLGGPKLALFASGLAAAAIAVATLTELVIRQHDEVIKASEAFETHLGNLDLAAAKTQMQDLSKQIGGVTDAITKMTYWQTVSYELFHKRPEGESFFKSLLNDIYHLTTGTTDLDDNLERLQKESADAQKVLSDKTKELAQAEKDRAYSLGQYFTTQKSSLDAKAQELGFSVLQNQFQQQLSSLRATELAQEQAINKEYALTPEQIRTGLTLTAQQISQRNQLITLTRQDYQLQLTAAAAAEARRKADATSKVVQSGLQAQSDLDNPATALAAAQVRAAREAQEQINAHDVDTDVINDARRQKELRAWRDYYQEITAAARQSEQEILNARSDIDPEADDASARLRVWQNYYDNLGKLGVNQVALARVTNEQIARLDRDRVQAGLNELKASTSAYQGHAGAVAAIAKGVNDAIRKYEIAVQVVKDVQQAKSQFAAGVADTAVGNFAGAALHFTASGLFAAAAAFGAAEALGAGGSASGGGGSAGGSQSSTFTPSDANQSGGQQINIYTVNPNDRSVIASTVYYMNQQQILKVPALLPPAPAGYAVGRAA